MVKRPTQHASIQTQLSRLRRRKRALDQAISALERYSGATRVDPEPVGLRLVDGTRPTAGAA